MANKVYIVDGNSLLFRAYYATAWDEDNLMRASDGTPTNAVFAFGNMINKILHNLKDGDGLFVGFDTGHQTFRHEEDEKYKANRKPCPEALKTQMPLARELLRSLGIFIYEQDGFEGDDICGTVAKLAGKEGYEVTIYTSDRDFLQLIDPNITVSLLKTGMSNMLIMNEETMPQTFGFTPKQIIDYKGLRGDTSDNLPGIPGVGEKTAVKLIQEYGGFESIVEAAKTMKSKVGESIIANQDLGRHCLEMATIKTDIELPFGVNDIIYSGYEFSKINSFCSALELKQLLNRLPSEYAKTDDSLGNFEYKEIENIDYINIKDEISIALDIDVGNYNTAQIYGLALLNDGKLYYIKKDNFKSKKLLEVLKDKNIKKYCYDYKAIKVALSHLDIEIDGLYFDILLAAYLIDSSLNNNITSIMHYFGADITSNKDESMSLFDNSDPERACKIAYFVKKVSNKIFAELTQHSMTDLYNQIEIPLCSVLAEMEIEGVPLHEDVLNKLGESYKEELEKHRTKIYEYAGCEFNIDSPKQVGEVLFDRLGLPNLGKGTSVEVLKDLSSKHPIVEEILQYRKYAKLLSTYVTGLTAHIKEDGKIHAMFNQALTQTGRLSSSEPNLQNISVRDEEGKAIRKAFYYDNENYSILSLDYSQIELRILASLSKCKQLQNIFATGEDIHTATAKSVFHTDNPTQQERRRAKAVNFGIIYGISDWGLSEQIDCTVPEAKKIIQNFYESYPEVAIYFQKVAESANKNQYVSTLLGRRRYLREIRDTNYQVREFARRAAMNAPIQGTAADLIKIAMIKVNNALKENGLESKLILQIHDELLLKVPEHEKKQTFDLVKDIMESALELDVDLKAEGGYGRTWYDCK